MGVIRPLSNGIDALWRNPVIAALVFAYSLLGAGASAIQMVDPLLVFPAIGILYLFIPFFIGGLVSTIHDGLGGKTSVDQFVAGGTSNYLPLFGGGLVLGIITFALYFAVAIVGAIVVVFVLGFGSMADVTSAAVAVLAVGGLIGLLIVLLPWFFLQFFPAAVVIDDLGLVDSFKRSGGLVKRNFLSVVGFDVLAFLIGLVAQISTVYLFLTAGDGSANPGTTGQTVFDALSTTELGIYLTMTVVLGTIVGAITQAYYVAYYDQLPQ